MGGALVPLSASPPSPRSLKGFSKCASGKKASLSLLLRAELCVNSGFCDVTSGLIASTEDGPPARKREALGAGFSPLGWFLESLTVF